MADAPKIKVYISSISSNMETKKQQQDIFFKLSSKKIAYEEIDVSQDGNLQKMREKMGEGHEKALAPQIFHEDTYLGNYEAFNNAVEAEIMNDFLKL
ncbi:SH3 domain-binding glutamic acid-rich-like protein 3 [Diadema antillarum]|uniref:SH3 domain-binding glutamic acid-rich-like protein 3 n=1 Tax=Diadema antillarum TaxID=105358 RepID=UPI003A87032E